MKQNDLSLEDWRLIQDCVVEQVFNLKSKQSQAGLEVAYQIRELQIRQLETLLDKISIKGLTPKV